MPLNIAKRKAATKNLIVPMDEDEIKLVYRPSERTPQVAIELQEKEGAEQTRFYIDWLSRILVSWDIEDDDGEPFPLTPENLAAMPQDVIAAIGDAIVQDMTPKAPTGKR